MMSELLGFPFGPLLAAAGSVVVLLVAARPRIGWLAWLAGIVGPWCVAGVMYLWPLLCLSDETLGDYGAWLGLFIIIGAVAGWVANALAAGVLWTRRRLRSTPVGS